MTADGSDAPSGPGGPDFEALDPFDLPDWLGVGDVVWASGSGLGTDATVTGELRGEVDGGPVSALPCDLLAVDEAYPAPVAGDRVRLEAHQAWRHGEVHLVSREGRLTLAVPGSCFDAQRTLDAVGRLARAVGAAPDRYAVRLQLGDPRRARR